MIVDVRFTPPEKSLATMEVYQRAVVRIGELASHSDEIREPFLNISAQGGSPAVPTGGIALRLRTMQRGYMPLAPVIAGQLLTRTKSRRPGGSAPLGAEAIASVLHVGGVGNHTPSAVLAHKR
jgi:hypothetical protein